MPFETITLSSAGSLSVAALCLTFALFQGFVAYKRPEFGWNRWGAAISLLTAVYSVAVFFQFNLSAGAHTRLCEKVQFSVFILLIEALYRFTFAFIGRSHRWLPKALPVLTVVCLALIWFTELIVATAFVQREFIWNPRPYIEPDLGPLGVVYLILTFTLAMAVVLIWWGPARRKVTGARELVACFFIWALLGLHDILATVGMPTVQFVMEFGFLGFSLSVISITIRKYIDLFTIVEENEQALQRTKESLERRVRERTAAIASSNQELKAEICDRKRAAKELRESEEKFRTLIANISDVIIILDREGTIRYSSPNLSRHFGWSPRDLQGQKFHETVHPDDREQIQRQVANLMTRPGRTLTLAFRYRTADQSYLHIELTLVNLLTTPRIQGLVGNFRDISERIASERALKRAQAIAHVGNWELDLTTRTIEGSEEWCRIFGLEDTGSGLALEAVQALIVEEDRRRVRRRLDALVFKGRAYDVTYRIRRADDNEQAWIHSRAELIRKAGGGVRISGVIQDITAAKQAAAEKAQLENQLRQAQKMESIGTLAGGIAHDFNNILSPIIGFAEMTAEDLPADSQARANMGEILKAGRRAQEMVQQILTFSRQNSQERKPVKVAPIIQESLKLMRSSLPSTIDIHPHIEDEYGFVMGDTTQIHQMIVNLCTNAYHAMRESGGALNVYLDETHFQAPDDVPLAGMTPGRYTRIRVQDSGYGIAPDMLERIFEPYFTTKAPGEGTGMGLSMVHGIVRNHNGFIDVASTVGEGTTFGLYLPQILHTDETSITETTNFIPLGNERLLLVDDEEQLLDMQSQMLERLGYEVTATSSSVEALSLFCQNPEDFDLMITDQTMPNLTGGELAAQVLHIREDLPIILCTGFSESLSPEAAAEIGIRHYLHKPIPLKSLARTVRIVLNDSFHADTPRSQAGCA
ncbi:MAG: PAS domain S-box protein [Desulfobacterales bacterium]|nr:PAS domain S-box protein [Desulfobacterales bacterium]MDJ0887673.1 PAS domain S-box protein [Desulfobacterales bacterium]MDJ0989080.1 PAS domain S-box protein [Desulfobacterales bacterium]